MNMEYTFPSLEMPFAEYIYFEKIFFPHEIEKIVALWYMDESQQAVMSSGYQDDTENMRRSTVQFLKNSEENRWIYDKLAMIVQQCNMQYFGFDLSGFKEQLQLTHYGPDDHFHWHMDFGPHEISHRKLSITVQLSDPDSYEGGDLLFRANDREEPAPRSAGTVVVFPSFVQHRVTPITSGERRSIVGWAAGRPYR